MEPPRARALDARYQRWDATGMADTTAAEWRKQIEKFERFSTHLPAMMRPVEIYDAFSPVFRCVYDGMVREAERVKGPARQLGAALDAYEVDESKASALGEALYDFSRAYGRLLQLRTVFEAEKHRMFETNPTLALGERGDSEG